MKPSRLNKVLGLSIGERSLFAAEVVSGERPEVKRLAEFVYPDGVSPSEAGPLGTALGEFLREQKFTAKSAVIGLPARWLVVKPKDVPPADAHTLAELLRLQAEGEFSSELKDLVYDYTADTTEGKPKSVLLVATSRRYIDGAVAMCDAARLTAIAVTPSAVALGAVTGRSVEAKNPLVLAVSPAGAELTAQSGGVSNAIRHLRGPGPDRPFVGELRRAISGMPAGSSNGSPRELVLWDAAGDSAFNSSSLGQDLGIHVRTGDLPILGVQTAGASSNGDGRKYASAVALALLGLSDDPQAIDFLHSRLAPPPARRIPLSVIFGSLAAVVVLALIFWGYSTMQARETQLANIQADNDSKAGDKKAALAFITTVTTAQGWHMDSPRYVMCLRDLTTAIPQDGVTYAMSLNLREMAPPSNTSGSATPAPAAVIRALTGRLECKTSDQLHAQQVLDRLKSMPKSFTDVKDAGRQIEGREHSVTISITFTYLPPK